MPVAVYTTATVQFFTKLLSAVKFRGLWHSLVLRLHREVRTARYAAAWHRSQPALAPRATAVHGVHLALYSTTVLGCTH